MSLVPPSLTFLSAKAAFHSFHNLTKVFEASLSEFFKFSKLIFVGW
ncbi:Uncharacterised protein, partial [Mycoplasmopsis synoviae]